MASRVVMPKLSDTMEEGRIIRWLRKEGDRVETGQALAEIETDKATVEMEAYTTGVVRKLVAAVAEGKSAMGPAPRYAAAGFRPNAQYVRELKRFGVLPAAFDLVRDPIDVFRADQDYWRSLWWTPAAGSGH